MERPSPKRILNLIEKLCCLYEDGTKSQKSGESYITDIYKFSHLVSNCENPHNDWVKQFYEIEKILKDY